MRADATSDADESRLHAIQRDLDLPGPGPAIVLVGTDDPDLTRLIEQAAAQRAEGIDVRGDIARLVVDNGLAFLERAGRLVEPSLRSGIRLAFAEPSASTDELVGQALRARDLESLIHRAERARFQHRPPRFEVRYQPIVSMHDRSIVGHEGLFRAVADGTIIDAEDLIARAGRGSWTAELDHLGRTLALQGLGPWLGRGLLFLNVMAPDGRFDESAIHATIDAAEAAGLEPDQLVLEAVERNRYVDLDEAAQQIGQFRRRGVRIAVDDVGDGYAGLRVLSAFDPDIIKIAGHLVTDLVLGASITGSDARGATMAHAIIATLVDLAHRSDTWVVAENIENEHQFEILRELGVDWGQGLYLGAPLGRPAQGTRTGSG